MALFQIAEDSTEVVKEIIVALGNIGLWLQAIGVLVILTIVAMIINFIINRKKLKRLKKLENKMHSIEDKLDKILKKRK